MEIDNITLRKAHFKWRNTIRWVPSRKLEFYFHITLWRPALGLMIFGVMIEIGWHFDLLYISVFWREQPTLTPLEILYLPDKCYPGMYIPYYKLNKEEKERDDGSS
jgi:hypothetical protein